MKHLRSGILLSALMLSISGCGTGTQQSSSKPTTNYSLAQLDSIGIAYKPEIGTYGGVINVSLAHDPDGFCPGLTSSGYSMDVIDYIYEGLVNLDPATNEYVPLLAESWSVSDDGLVWTFKIREGITFSDSVEMTADDVIFTYNDVIYNEALRSPLNYNFRVDNKKVDVKKVGKYTVTFTLPKPFAPFLTMTNAKILPRHKYGAAAKAGTLQADLSSGAKPENVVGTGAFRLKKVELGQRITLERNPYYHKKDAAGNQLPYLDGVNLHILKEPNVQMMKFKNGEIDQLSVTGDHYPMLKPIEEAKGFKLYRVGPSWYDSFFKFNQNNQSDSTGKPYVPAKKLEWFRTKEFRQACAYGISYDELINIIYNGLAYPPGGTWGAHKGKFHNPNARTYSFNPQKADSLLKSIGMIDRDGDGVREDSTGAPVEFTISTSAGVKLIEDYYSIVRKDLENIGLKVHLDFVEFNTLIERISNTFDWDATAYALGGVRDPHFGKSSYISKSFRYGINPQRKRKDGTLIPKEDRPFELRINEIFDLAVSEMDEEKRATLYQEWQKISQEECLTIYMPLKEVVLGVQNRFGNIHLTSNLSYAGQILHNPEEIFIKK